MNSFWLQTASNCTLTLDTIEHPYFRLTSVADMWTSRDDGPESVPTKAIQCLRHGDADLSQSDGQRLIFVLLEVPVAAAILSSGDTLLLAPNVDPAAALSASDDCHLLVLHLGEWVPKVIPGDLPPATPFAAQRQPNFIWLFTGTDHEANFAEFAQMFDEKAGWLPSTVREQR